MLIVDELFPLSKLNTFGIEAVADYFISLNTIDDVKEFCKSDYRLLSMQIIGGGSNILFTGNYKGILVKPNILGMSIVDEDHEYVVVKAGAGVDWDTFVAWSVNNSFGGLENLSNIPGNVGASPVQNIGAYGVEIKDTLLFVEGYYLQDGRTFQLKNFECEFGYRTSIFKTRLKDKVIITNVAFKLCKKCEFNTEYASISGEVDILGGNSLKNIRQAIINIRSQKLPSPAKIGNAGSFFKNPIVSASKILRLKKKYPDLPNFFVSHDLTKTSAAFLIDKCGWRGYRNGDVGVHDKQPLVLVNYGKAKGIEILDLAHKIKDSVRLTFDIELELEVNVV